MARGSKSLYIPGLRIEVIEVNKKNIIIKPWCHKGIKKGKADVDKKLLEVIEKESRELFIVPGKELRKYFFLSFWTACRVDATHGWISAGEQTYTDLFRSRGMTDRDYFCICCSFSRNLLPDVAASRDNICHLAVNMRRQQISQHYQKCCQYFILFKMVK